MERWLSSLSLSGSTMLSGKLAAYKHRLADSYKYFTEEEKPNVLILFCGGTIIMKASADGSLIVPEDKEEAVQLLIDLEPLVDEIANLDVKFIENIDSTNMNNRIWDKIGQVIDDNYDSYDGFVITHGTDTLAYTASALSFSLGDLGKPVCITGAQIPGGRLETDARMNFVNAVRIATLKKAGVMVVFNESVILGARSHKMSESKLNAFGSMNRHNYGEIRVDIRFREEAKDRHDRPLDFQPGFQTSISVFTLFPGFPVNQIESAIAWGVKGIILRGYGSGNISYEYLEAVKFAFKKHTPVVVDTQCLEGATLMHLYDVGKQALDNGVIQAYDMSTECIITKLMWALKHADSYDNIREIMHTDYTGELNKEGRLY